MIIMLILNRRISLKGVEGRFLSGPGGEPGEHFSGISLKGVEGVSCTGYCGGWDWVFVGWVDCQCFMYASLRLYAA